MIITRLEDPAQLANFNCGLAPMDEYIHKELTDSLFSHYCEAYIGVDEQGEVEAFFALSCDSLDLDEEDKEDLMSSDAMPDISDEYQDIFFNKFHYPAIEIKYLAVRTSSQKQGVGSAIVEAIADKVRNESIAGCMFLSVEALKTPEYTAVPFYDKCNFSACEFPDPNKQTLRMYRTLYPNKS